MKLTIDPAADALYLTLGDADIVTTKQVAPGVMLDFDAEGRVVGVEMLSISTRAPQAELNKMLFETLGAAA